MNTKRILCGILAAAMLLCLMGCGESDFPETTESPKKTSVTTSASTPESAPNSGEATGYKLPAGAESEYALYETVVDFLNNGFRYTDLKDVFDPNLSIVFFSKCERKSEEIFTRGMKYDEACDLIARLIRTAAGMDFLTDEDGEINMDYIDYDAFLNEFPESLRSQIDAEDDYFEDFIEMILYHDELFRDGENPFGTGQTEWEKESQDTLETYEYDEYENWDKDLFLNFPRVYGMELGTYISGGATSMYAYYTVINGRYYFVGFSYAVSGIGG